ncbi:MAG: hypothetical protein P8P30_00125 [Rickettsiales bacterium]|nr:hypothetical protein [Rickettsiales bacterium]
MLHSDYSFASLCLIAALALFFALLLRITDGKLRLLRAIPSPLAAWRRICASFVQKLNRQERSSGALRTRGRILLFTLLSFAFLFGMLMEKILVELHNDYLETILLALIFLALPNAPVPKKKEAATTFRTGIESGGVTLLQHVLAPLTGWLLLGWPGIFMMITLLGVRKAVMNIQTGFGYSIRRTTKLLLFPAGLLGIGIISLASFFTSKGKPLAAMRLGFEKMLTPHIAVMATISEALHLSLGGPSSYYLDLFGREWLGNGIARLQEPDMKRWTWLLTISHCSLIVLLTTLALLL